MKQDTPNWFARFVRQLLGLTAVATFSVSINPASVNAEASGDTTFAATGALLGDFVMGWGNSADIVTGVNFDAVVTISAADTGNFHLCNGNAAAGAAIDIAAFTISGVVGRLAGS